MMKKILLTLLAPAVLQLSTVQVNAQAMPAGKNPTDKQWANMPAHPRLLATKGRVAQLKKQNDEVSENLFYLLRTEADKALTAPKIVYPEGKTFKFYAARTAQGRILTLALGYRLFGDKRYLERARAELIQLSELPDWCPSHFIDVGEASLAAGIGLDWLYNDLTEADRKTITRGIVRNALEPSLLFDENEVNDLNGNFNHNPVDNAGLIVGALAVADSERALAKKVVDRAIKFLPNATAAYAPDGSYPEGPTYWAYGTTFHVIAVEALRSVFGDSFDLEKAPGFLASIDFMGQIVGPTGHDYNYGDATSAPMTEVVDRFTSEPVMLWFARELKHQEIAATETKSLAKAKNELKNGATDTYAKQLSRQLALEALWWSPGLPEGSYHLPLHWTARGLTPLAVMRSAWGDPMATYVAMKGGTPNNSHGQMDIGSFILEAKGIRWAVDMGGESYDKMRAAKLDLWNYAQNSDRWTTFRPGPEAHNILRFDNARQDITGKAEISALPATNGVVGNVIDLTSLYKSKVENVSRTIKLHPDGHVTIRDDWESGASGVETTFQWLTKAKVTVRTHGFLLGESGKSLLVEVEAPGSGSAPEITVQDVSAAVAPQDSPNPGVSRVSIKVKTPAHTKASLVISARAALL